MRLGDVARPCAANPTQRCPFLAPASPCPHHQAVAAGGGPVAYGQKTADVPGQGSRLSARRPLAAQAPVAGHHPALPLRRPAGPSPEGGPRGAHNAPGAATVQPGAAGSRAATPRDGHGVGAVRAPGRRPFLAAPTSRVSQAGLPRGGWDDACSGGRRTPALCRFLSVRYRTPKTSCWANSKRYL